VKVLFSIVYVGIQISGGNWTRAQGIEHCW
jgi:hypothetical protein